MDVLHDESLNESVLRCFPMQNVFTARRYASARSLLSPGVRPSICPSPWCIQGRGDWGGGYIGIYTLKISNPFVHVWDINICFEIAMTS